MSLAKLVPALNNGFEYQTPTEAFMHQVALVARLVQQSAGDGRGLSFTIPQVDESPGHTVEDPVFLEIDRRLEINRNSVSLPGYTVHLRITASFLKDDVDVAKLVDFNPSELNRTVSSFFGFPINEDPFLNLLGEVYGSDLFIFISASADAGMLISTGLFGRGQQLARFELIATQSEPKPN